MIQRIQSIYLLFTAILMAVTVFSPIMAFSMGENNPTMFLDSFGFFADNDPNITTQSTWGILFMTVIATLLSFLNIFFFKKRKIQIKICKYTNLFILFFYITLAAYSYISLNTLSIEFESIKYGIILPIIAFIFNILAMKKIKSDLKLVESLNRIR